MMMQDSLGKPLAALSEGEKFDWLRLFRCDNIGPRTFQYLLKRYGSAGAALAALPELIAKDKAGRPLRIAAIEEIEREIDAASKLGGRFIAFCEPDYPALLRRISSAPPLIAVRGNLLSLQRSKIAIIGARNASAAGLAIAAQLARGIGRAGHVIVSGLARGIDASAHQSAIETGTIAVVAGGLGNIYPAEHQNLLEQILEQGAAVSEMPFGWEARGRDFPRRNRIVAGLSRVVVVVEAARRSGSLITARFAAEQGREIFACPGSPLDPRAEGANQLLRDGASFCTKPDDVLEALAEEDRVAKAAASGFYEAGGAEPADKPLWDELDLPGIAGAPPAAGGFAAQPRGSGVARADDPRVPDDMAGEFPPGDVAARIAGLLGPVPVSVDDLARLAEAPARQVRTILSGLELAGKVVWQGGDLVSARQMAAEIDGRRGPCAPWPGSWPTANDPEE
jgi:DNA processing protein